MKKVAILFGLALGWAQTGFTADATPVGDAAAGEAMTAACAACHGADGNSAAPTFPKLAGQGEKYLFKQLLDIRDGARPVPTMAGQLDGKSDQDLADIAAFYAAQARSVARQIRNCWHWVKRCTAAACRSAMSPPALRVTRPRARAMPRLAFPPWPGSTPTILRPSCGLIARVMRMKPVAPTMAIPKSCVPPPSALSDKEIEAVSSYVAGLK